MLKDDIFVNLVHEMTIILFKEQHEKTFVNIFFIAFCTFIYNIYCASRIGVVRDIRFFLRAIVDFL